jgi:hypothetical protein
MTTPAKTRKGPPAVRTEADRRTCFTAAMLILMQAEGMQFRLAGRREFLEQVAANLLRMAEETAADIRAQSPRSVLNKGIRRLKRELEFD